MTQSPWTRTEYVARHGGEDYDNGKVRVCGRTDCACISALVLDELGTEWAPEAPTTYRLPAGAVAEGDIIALGGPARAARVLLREEDGPRVRWVAVDLATGADCTVTRLRAKLVPVHAQHGAR